MNSSQAQPLAASTAPPKPEIEVKLALDGWARITEAIEAGWPRRGTRLGAQHESAATPKAAGAISQTTTNASRFQTQMRGSVGRRLQDLQQPCRS